MIGPPRTRAPHSATEFRRRPRRSAHTEATISIGRVGAISALTTSSGWAISSSAALSASIGAPQTGEVLLWRLCGQSTWEAVDAEAKPAVKPTIATVVAPSSTRAIVGLTHDEASQTGGQADQPAPSPHPPRRPGSRAVAKLCLRGDADNRHAHGTSPNSPRWWQRRRRRSSSNAVIVSITPERQFADQS